MAGRPGSFSGATSLLALVESISADVQAGLADQEQLAAELAKDKGAEWPCVLPPAEAAPMLQDEEAREAQRRAKSRKRNTASGAPTSANDLLVAVDDTSAIVRAGLADQKRFAAELARTEAAAADVATALPPWRQRGGRRRRP